MGGWALRALGEAGRVRRERGGLAAVDPLLGSPALTPRVVYPGTLRACPDGESDGTGQGFLVEVTGIAKA